MMTFLELRCDKTSIKEVDLRVREFDDFPDCKPRNETLEAPRYGSSFQNRNQQSISELRVQLDIIIVSLMFLGNSFVSRSVLNAFVCFCINVQSFKDPNFAQSMLPNTAILKDVQSSVP